MKNGNDLLLHHGSSLVYKTQRRAAHTALLSVPRADAGLKYTYFETAKFLHALVTQPELCNSSQAIWKGIKRYTYSNVLLAGLWNGHSGRQRPCH